MINNSDDKDIVFYSDNGSESITEYFRVDGSLGINRFIRNSRHNDNVHGTFGTSDDLKIYHDSNNSYIENSTGGLYIMSRADDADLVLMCDDGSGGDTAYLTLDGSLGFTTAQKAIRFEDNVRSFFGTGADLSIYLLPQVFSINLKFLVPIIPKLIFRLSDAFHFKDAIFKKAV